MRQLKAGSEAAFRELVERYREPLYRLSVSLLLDRMAADDAVQETFIRLWTRVRRYHPRYTVRTWIYTICVRRCYDELRRRRRHREAVEALPTGGVDVNRMEADELLMLLQRVTVQLPPRQRVVYQLRELDGFSAEETSATTGMSLEQVKANLWVARNTVKEKLKQYGVQ